MDMTPFRGSSLSIISQHDLLLTLLDSKWYSANSIVEEKKHIRPSRPRAMTNASNGNAHVKSSLQVARGKHIRATSELPSLRSARKGPRSTSIDSFELHTKGVGADATELEELHLRSRSPVMSDQITSNPSKDLSSNGDDPQSTAHDVAPERQRTTESRESGPQQSSELVYRHTSLGIADSFLKIDDDHYSVGSGENYDPQSPAISETTLKPVWSDEAGVPFEVLVDRLVAQNAKSDGKFTAIFLCFYRKFAAPTDLILALVARFERFGASEAVQATRISAQLRCLNMFSQWMSEYPGDFAHPQTRQIMTNFVNGILGNGHFTAAAKEVAFQLDVVTEDDDTEWACSDVKRARSNTIESFLSISSTHSAASTLNADSSTEDVGNSSLITQTNSRHTPRHSATSSMSSNTGRSGSQSTGSFQTLLNSIEDAQRYARFLTPSPRFPLTKVHWHQLVEIPEEDIAKELTRIDWIMFSSIRPRDLIRHVSLQPNEKRKCKQLENVNRMINHFNHVAFWVANHILLRDKPKHRAKTLERFMSIAWVSMPHLSTRLKETNCRF